MRTIKESLTVAVLLVFALALTGCMSLSVTAPDGTTLKSTSVLTKVNGSLHTTDQDGNPIRLDYSRGSDPIIIQTPYGSVRPSGGE